MRNTILNSLMLDDQRVCMYWFGDGKDMPGCDNGVETHSSSTLSDLGSLPVNEVSDMFKTTFTGVTYDLDKNAAQFQLIVRPIDKLRNGAYIVAAFDNPENVEKPLTADYRWRDGDTESRFTSPPVKGMKCGNYWVNVVAFGTIAKEKIISTHHQLIQPRVNFTNVESSEDLAKALKDGACEIK